MDQDIRKLLSDYWNQQRNTKAQLAAFAATLEPPVDLDVANTTGSMLGDLIRHCDGNHIGLRYDEDLDGWHQVAVFVTDGPPTTPPVEQDEVEKPPPEDDFGPYMDGAPYDGANASEGPEEEAPADVSDPVTDVLDELEEINRPPPAHQNWTPPEELKRKERTMVLLAQLREWLA